MISESCMTDSNANKRRLYFNRKKLEMLTIYRDSIERRLSALNASIDTLSQQIKRDEFDGTEVN